MGTTTSITALVDADPDAVFATVTDPGRLPEWNEAIKRVIESPVALGEGDEWVVEMHALGRQLAGHELVKSVAAIASTARATASRG